MVDPSSFEKLDRLIHERGRFAIMSLLAATESLSFTELKEQLRMTDGNLSVHMRTLEEAGYVLVDKSFVNRKPRTVFSLTDNGRAAFGSYIQTLEGIVKESQRAAEAYRPLDRETRRDLKAVIKPGMAPAK
jgi:DNA-binding MarR family transcriptional regulator